MYKQIHKHFDPLFHDPRNVPPEEDEESESSGPKEKSPVVPKSPPRLAQPAETRSSPSRAARLRSVFHKMSGFSSYNLSVVIHEKRTEFSTQIMLFSIIFAYKVAFRINQSL